MQIFRVLERAVETAYDRRAARSADGGFPELGPPALTAAVRQQVVADRAPPHPARSLLADADFVADVRRTFIEVAVRECPEESADALRILEALEGVPETPAAREDPVALDERAEAMSLVVEIAHDMRSPLSAILFLLDALRLERSGPVTALQARQLSLAYGAAFGLSQLASDLIDCARDGDRLVDREPVPFSILEMLHSVRDIVQPMAEEKGLALEVHSVEEDVRSGFPVALHRILLNLTTNSIKFTSQGSVQLSARAHDGSRIGFAVRDTGEGIPSHVLHDLIEPLRRRRIDEHVFSSAGLGLAICHKLTRMLGSELQVATATPGGTTISFELDLPPGRPAS